MRTDVHVQTMVEDGNRAMTHHPEESRAYLLQAAADLAEESGSDLQQMLTRYYQHVATEDLLTRRPEDLLGAALSHRSLAARRPMGTANVRVFTPTVDQQGWSSGHTVVEIVTDDMPFLVDSVSAEMTKQGRTIHLIVHPVLVVRRDASGELQEIVDVDVADVPQEFGVATESWMHVQIDRESDPAAREALTERLRAALSDVRVAVEDWPRMIARAEAIAAGLADTPPAGVPADEVSQARELLIWLATGQFTFLGYREYLLGVGDILEPVSGTGLGLLRYDESRTAPHLTPLPQAVAAKAREPRLLIVTKANSVATVHRAVFLDYVGVKSFDESGAVVGERRFLGLFTASAYTLSVLRVPYVRDKAAQVIARSGFHSDSHLGKDLLGVLETYPRDELFQADVDTLTASALAVVHLRERRRARLFLRRDEFGRFMSCLVYLPRDRYTTSVRLKLEALLREAYNGSDVEYTTRVSESALARLHFVIRVPPGEQIPDVDVDDLERRVLDAIRSWEATLGESALSEYGEELGSRLQRRYRQAFPEAYKEDFHPRVGVADMRHLEALETDDLQLNLYQPPGSPAGERRLKLYRREALLLTEILPVFTHLGVQVTDERPYDLHLDDGQVRYIYDFGLRAPSEANWSQGQDGIRERFHDAFAAVWSGAAESDRFNALVLSAGLTWREVVILRSVAKYLRQAGSLFSQLYIEDALRHHSGLARRLVELFALRFDPDGPFGTAVGPQRVAAEDNLVAGILEDLDRVDSLDEDRMIRSFLEVILATLRTNFFQRPSRPLGLGGLGDDGAIPSYQPTVCFKLDPTRIPNLPNPRPKFEIWVYSPRVEGVHLRFGNVARGGLRWSDRREDFRTEVLGLVKAQMVKNAVIVPTGSKGGFYPKMLPDPAQDRAAWLAEGITAYTLFISSLLDVTDNLLGGEVIPPERVVRHDGDDPYLVVAADKGTAAFSDIANGVAQAYGYWLDDAFASGGSAGYDHKGMGITARGAWESVKRHFREMGRDTQTDPFTVVGIGDMSGDVFGNGMMLSPVTRLVAAFDHRHVFLDPDPDLATSFAERRRLFDLPRSSWADYESGLISPGGGVFPRTAKSVPISRQVAASLGLPEETSTLTPSELMRAILLAPVDLLWNGGIGTYIKASTQTNAEIGDRANDSIRVDGAQLRCQVVGEGGNLGASQLGRIEAAEHGIRINTDAIDNSAGVDTSDHEVNIKILLTELTREGDLTLKQRNAILAGMTDDVARQVLRDNYEQNVLIGNARAIQRRMIGIQQRLMQWLEARGDLDRQIEFLPDDADLEQRQQDGRGLTSPEFSVLLAYAKLALKEDLAASALPDEPWFVRVLADYFPADIRERFPERLQRHPLRRQIIVNSIANSVVNRGGVTFVYRAMEETGATAEQIARAFVVCREVFGLAEFVTDVEELDNVVPTAVQAELYLEFRRLLDLGVRWFLQNRPVVVDVGEEVARFGPTVRQLSEQMAQFLCGEELERLTQAVADLVAQGVPTELAEVAASLVDLLSCLDIVELAENSGQDAAAVAPIYFAVSAHFGINGLLGMVNALPREDRWDSLARGSMRDDLYAVLTSLTSAVMAATDPGRPSAERLEDWARVHRDSLERTRRVLADIAVHDTPGLAPLSVALRSLRSVVRAATASVHGASM
ncbi:MAG TPA: NAD-glutamate dehydrogenase [Dermatophilaceae bacterium]|nr:NAD-glutamate dehydrogenase [Dermatophilaceae bacterium]